MGLAMARGGGTHPAATRERIDRGAYELFSRHGVRKVGVDTVSAHCGVAKMTLYKHYPSKDDLAIAFLRRREELWTQSWLRKEMERGARTPAGQLLAAFDAFDKWFRRTDFEGCAFVNVMLEHKGDAHPVGKAAKAHLVKIRAFLRKLARDAGARDADAFARQWQMVMMGTIVAACAGDKDAARRGKDIGSMLLAREGIA